MAKHSPPTRQEKKQISEQLTHLYEGPIPPPATLAAFNTIIPDGAHRIMLMAEKDQEHKLTTQQQIISARDNASRREHIEIVLGQIFAFLLCACALLGGIYLMFEGHFISGGLLSGVSLASVLKTLITRGKN